MTTKVWAAKLVWGYCRVSPPAKEVQKRARRKLREWAERAEPPTREEIEEAFWPGLTAGKRMEYGIGLSFRVEQIFSEVRKRRSRMGKE